MTIYKAPLGGQHVVEVVQIEQDQGLAQRTVEKVIRDQYGYFYLFMKDAVQRYDGSYFTSVNMDALTDSKRSGMDITSVDLLADGTISISCQNTDEHFIIEPHGLSISTLPLSGNILVSDGKLYHSIRKDGKYLLSSVDYSDIKKPTLKPILDLEFEPFQYIPHQAAHYFSTADSSIYSIIEGQLKKHSEKGLIISNDKNVLLWTRTAVYRFQEDELKRITSFLPMELTMLKKDKKGDIIASYSANPRIQTKIFVLTPALEFKTYDNIIGVSKYYKDFYTDDTSYKWMLVGYNSIQVVNLLREGISIINKNPNVKKGQFGNVIPGVAADEKGNVYFAKESKGIFKVTSKDSANLVHNKKVYDDNFINNERLYYSKHDELFYIYNYRYDGTTDIIQSDFEKKTFLKNRIPFKATTLYPLSAHELLIGGYDQPTNLGRINIYDYKRKQLRTVKTDLPRVRSIYFDNDSKIYWIGTINGLYIMDKDFENIAVLDNTKNEATQQFLPNDYIITIHEFSGKMLLGSYGNGIYVINKQTYKLEQTLSKQQGLTDNIVVGIIPDDLGHCWLTTFNGINILDSSLTVVHKLYDHQGLSDREFNTQAIAKDDKGHIYAGSLNGVTRFDPTKILHWTETSGFDITAMHVFDKGRATKLENKNPIQIYADADSLTVDLLYPDYYKFPFMEAKAKVVWDKSLADVKLNKTYLSITNLKPGTQEIQIANERSTIKNDLTISVRKDYRSLLSTLGILLLMGFISLLIIRSNKNKESERTELNRKLSELQLTSLQSQMNPHFIFNALGAIQYFIQTHDAEKADEYLSNFAMLMRRILESSKSKYIGLQNEIDLLQLYIGLEAIRFENKFEYEIVLDDDLDMDINVPPMIIQPYIENAINHGIYNLADRVGQLVIRFVQVDEDTIQCIVTDNGVGRKRAQELRTKRHKSRGMQIVKERIDTINTAEDLNVSIAVNDILRHGDVAGTEAIITIKEFQ